jgi:hypothetical protein
VLTDLNRAGTGPPGPERRSTGTHESSRGSGWNTSSECRREETTRLQLYRERKSSSNGAVAAEQAELNKGKNVIIREERLKSYKHKIWLK